MAQTPDSNPLPSVPNPRIIIPGDVDQSRGYRITKWHHYDNYECLECQYSTLWLHKMEKHLDRGEHPWAYPNEGDGTPGNTADGTKGGPEY